MLVQYDELTIRAMRAMRYAAALTVQAADCSFWPEQLLAVVGCASLQRQCWPPTPRGPTSQPSIVLQGPVLLQKRPPHECHQ